MQPVCVRGAGNGEWNLAIPPDTCPLRYGPATPADLIGFTVVYLLISTRSAALCICSVPAPAVKSAEFSTEQTGSHAPEQQNSGNSSVLRCQLYCAISIYLVCNPHFFTSDPDTWIWISTDTIPIPELCLLWYYYHHYCWFYMRLK